MNYERTLASLKLQEAREIFMKKIMIVDDEPTILLSLSHILSDKDTSVVTCATIEDAEKALLHHTFDLVLADIRLTGMYGIEGLELLTYIKKHCSKTEVIIMTAYGSEEMKKEAYRLGAFHYYEKPIDLNHLASKVKSLVGSI